MLVQEKALAQRKRVVVRWSEWTGREQETMTVKWIAVVGVAVVVAVTGKRFGGNLCCSPISCCGVNNCIEAGPVGEYEGGVTTLPRLGV